MGIDRYFEDENRERNKVREKQNKEIEDLKARNAELTKACNAGLSACQKALRDLPRPNTYRILSETIDYVKECLDGRRQ